MLHRSDRIRADTFFVCGGFILGEGGRRLVRRLRPDSRLLVEVTIRIGGTVSDVLISYVRELFWFSKKSQKKFRVILVHAPCHKFTHSLNHHNPVRS